MFVDEVRVHVKGGAGGAGVASFRRRKGKPKGKPDGGSGGRGGDVYFEADADAATLLELKRKPHRAARDGTHGQGELRHGGGGDDLVIAVPLGTVIHEDGIVVADLVHPGQRYLAANGGRGGRGNAAFVSREHRAPTFAEQGEYGEERTYVLELKLIADAALVGFPNAGKSTLIARVSAARPKIADYPFTTLQPNLGVVAIDGREFVLADVPGLIEGAAAGKGLGHEFLRHVERARVLVILLDPTPLQETSYADQYRILIEELAAHSPELAARPRLVVLNKIDAVADLDDVVEWGTQYGVEVFAISAVTGKGVDRLMYSVAELVDAAGRDAPGRQGFVLHRPAPSGFDVVRRGDTWVVTGKAAERAVALADLTVPQAADFAARRLARLGVDDALRAAGAQPGDDVQIGDLVFEFHDDLEDGEE